MRDVKILLIAMILLFLPQAPNIYHAPLRTQKEIKRDYMRKIDVLLEKKEYASVIKLVNASYSETKLPLLEIKNKIKTHIAQEEKKHKQAIKSIDLLLKT